MKKVFFLSVIAAAVLTSCSKTLPQPEQITVNPSPLAVVGDQVNATITGTFPVKQFNKKGVLTVTPVLKFEGQEVLGTPVTYVGEKVKEEGKVVNFKEGGNYSQSCSFAFNPAMEKSELFLRFSAKVGKKEIEVPDLKVADGVMATSRLAIAEDNNSILTADKFQRIIQQTQEAEIKFLIQQATLRNSETKSDLVKSFQAAVKDANDDEKKAINKLEVSGYASPDGGVDLNTKLATERQVNAQKFLAKQLKKDKVNAEIGTTITAEDWAGFQAAVENSNIQDKDLVLRVLSMYTDPEEREAQIKNLSAVYKNIAEEILPALRRSRLILTTDLIGKSDEEIADFVKNDPSQLDVEEMLYAATLTADKQEKLAIYNQAAQQFGDFRAFNNAGLVHFELGNTADARRSFDKALEIVPNNADVHFNAGLAAMAESDLQKAEEHLGKAAGANGNLKAALGTLYLLKGDYANAKTSLENTTSNNAAVIQILTEDYAAARKTLNSVKEPNAVTAYLMAIVGARTNDRDVVYTNLKVAVERDAELKAKAAKDIEFAKFENDADFMSIVK